MINSVWKFIAGSGWKLISGLSDRFYLFRPQLDDFDQLDPDAKLLTDEDLKKLNQFEKSRSNHLKLERAIHDPLLNPEPQGGGKIDFQL